MFRLLPISDIYFSVFYIQSLIFHFLSLSLEHFLYQLSITISIYISRLAQFLPCFVTIMWRVLTLFFSLLMILRDDMSAWLIETKFFIFFFTFLQLLIKDFRNFSRLRAHSTSFTDNNVIFEVFISRYMIVDFFSELLVCSLTLVSLFWPTFQRISFNFPRAQERKSFEHEKKSLLPYQTTVEHNSIY